MKQPLRILILSLPLSFLPCTTAAQSGGQSLRVEKDATLLLAQAVRRQAGQRQAVPRTPAQPQRRVMHTGHIEIITNPPGFEIFVNGTKRPERTNAILELLEGRYQIELFLPATSYRQSFNVELLPADILTQRFEMHGSLQVDSFWARDGKKSTGPALELYLDGNRISQGKRIDKVVAGMHNLRVSYGSMKKTQRVEIRPGSALQVNYSVERGWDSDPSRVPN
jgi:hypothetical protein